MENKEFQFKTTLGTLEFLIRKNSPKLRLGVVYNLIVQQMKTKEMKTLFFMWAVMLLSFSTAAQNTTDLLNHYIDVKNTLVKSDSKGASQAIGTFYQSLKNDQNFAQKDNLLKATNKLSKANNLEKQRASFNEVSTLMWKLVKGSDTVNQTVYYQYCPMKKAYWLSREKEIKNPYYGSSMLTCGKVSETNK